MRSTKLPDCALIIMPAVQMYNSPYTVTLMCIHKKPSRGHSSYIARISDISHNANDQSSLAVFI